MITQKKTKSTCPDCNAELSSEGRCFLCGYELGLDKPPKGKLAYSKPAHFALGVGQFASILSCIASVIGAMMCLGQGHYWLAFFSIPAFLYSFAMWVVFKRAENTPPPND